MSNDSKNADMNGRSGLGKKEAIHSNDTTHKTAQQSQDVPHQQNERNRQQGGSDHKGGQQSQGDSRKNSDGTRQGGSGHSGTDQQQSNDSHKGDQSKQR